MERRIWSVSWRIGLFLLIWGVLLAPLVAPVAAPSQLYLESMSAITLFAAAVIMRRIVERQPIVSLGFRPNHVARDGAAGLGIGMSMMAACAGLPIAGARLGMLAVIVIINTFSQELLVRGYIQQTLNSRFAATPSIIVSAILFTLLHGAAIKVPIFAFNIFLAGLLLAVAYAVTRNLWLPIGIHFGWNFFQAAIFGFRSIGIEGGLTATIATLIGLAVVIASFYSARQMASAAP